MGSLGHLITSLGFNKSSLEVKISRIFKWSRPPRPTIDSRSYLLLAVGSFKGTNWRCKWLSIGEEQPIANSSLALTIADRLLPAHHLEEHTPPRPEGLTLPLQAGFFIKGGDLRNVWDPIYNQKRIYIKVISEKPQMEVIFLGSSTPLSIINYV
ncbi:hypothetical protein M9H77_03211 [Catharanthus roseus]|uniref:Uncharacterized protein n=1 Tax=Catharanthus roseus TaxID=4058 RepID=A0ACC0CAH5_CATRO|nr:hypothetical protein M9H77_03211 [Catharanthus roseus]